MTHPDMTSYGFGRRDAFRQRQLQNSSKVPTFEGPVAR